MEGIRLSGYQGVWIRTSGNQETLSLTIDDSSWFFVFFVVKSQLKKQSQSLRALRSQR